MKNNFYIGLFLLSSSMLIGQEIKQDTLNEVIITSSRIDLPFSKNSRTITVISNKDIKSSASTNLADLLQEVAGIDVRTRGIDGMQTDIYIRGGHFNQTLLLIDGIKTEDPQTGHHTMNSIIALENIERIEIIKGPAARIFGQNAFNGAINIVTKNNFKKSLNIGIGSGSYERKNTKLTASKQFNNTAVLINYNYLESDGYRENTDFKNHNAFLKVNFKTKNDPISLIASFADRKFGANNFYTNSPSFNEYEETQTSLVGVSTKFKKNNFTFKPKVYWKRNQDMFLLKREDPSFSRNFNISNKVGAEINTSFTSKIGITGFGVDVAKVGLSSNNLGDQDRTMFTTFLEHRFSFADDKLDITPGASFNYYSDFDTNVFPGIDVGYHVNNNFKIYWNYGFSYRVPTYTELYVNIPNFLSGNENLKPEEATSQEIGFKYQKNNVFTLDGSLFYRVANDLIDYVKEEETSPFFLAQNLRKIVSQGFELNSSYKFKVLGLDQKLNIAYTFLEDDYKETNVFASRYLINTSIKHHFTTNLQTQFIKNLTQSISYKYVERPTNSYGIVDAKANYKWQNLNAFVLFNNIFDKEYIEINNVPMPKSNFIIGLNYTFE